jgi:ABC-type lipoprotein export system ATPase subunit
MSAVLELREVAKRYRSGSEIVNAADGVSLTVARGEMVALYGPSGSGKSTLLTLAAGIIQPDAGAVLFEGRNLGGFTSAEMTMYRLRSIGVVLQSMQLQPGMSAIDNAAVKLVAQGMNPRRSRAHAEPLLDQVGLAQRVHHRPDDLSTGEQLRVCIVRALVNQPPLVLADEPAGNLDTAGKRHILGLLAEICATRGVGVLLVTHDEQMAASYATRTLRLQDGQLSERVLMPALTSAARPVGA